jgi:hypothetical protein
MEMETPEEKKERLAIRKELETVLGKIMLNEELKPVFEKIILHKCLAIEPVPLVERGGCHAEEIQQIESLRWYMANQGKLIIKTLTPSRALISEYAVTIAHVTVTNVETALSKIAQKLSNCSCTCSCGKPVDPI